jgi:hypothetical protein
MLQEQQRQGGLAEFLRLQIKLREDSVLKKLAQDNPEALNAWIQRIPDFSEENVAYQIYRGSEINRVLLIYNTRRMIDFIEKRQLNPNASGDTGLLHKPAALAFHVDPYSSEAWITRLQGTTE